MAATAKVQQLAIPYEYPRLNGPSAGRRKDAVSTCAACRERRAGAGHHTPRMARYPALCFACFKREVERLRARRPPPQASLASAARVPPRGSGSLYQELERRRRLAQMAARHALERS